MSLPELTLNQTIPLRHGGSCNLIGISPQGDLFVEEWYGDEDDPRIAQHRIAQSGEMIESADESDEKRAFSPLTLPENLIRPAEIVRGQAFNFVGPRFRGLRETDRIQETAQVFSVMEKMTLAAKLRLDFPPPLLIGLAESLVLAEASITEKWLVVCRRVRLAYALPQIQLDAHGLPYDYDSLTLFVAHFYDPATGRVPDLASCLDDLAGWQLRQPADCLIHEGRLYLADGGEMLNRVLIAATSFAPSAYT